MSDQEPGITCRNLINPNGQSFASEVAAFTGILKDLDNLERVHFRDSNANAIAQDESDRLLVVAGPGAGKSFLFMARISNWLPRHPGARIYVSSFVRKLVRDLQLDVEHRVPEEHQSRVTVSTLHSLARSLVERTHGTIARPLRPHVQVITGNWTAVVWRDVLQFHSTLSATRYTHRSFEKRLHTEETSDDSDDIEWVQVGDALRTLSQFYNALGFADLIALAREVVEERPEINEHLLWIIDEFQDFNASENHLIRSLTESALGVLIAGDDEQALYQQLKASMPEIIISYYDDAGYANAMLPYCSRCSYHVCLTASAFIAEGRDPGAIDKVYLPLTVDSTAPRVQVVATNAPSAAVDYIMKFIDDHRAELEAHIEKMEAGEETDPFLLILSPEKRAKFFNTNGADQALLGFLEQWSPIGAGHSSDYHKLLTYCRVVWDPSDNFATRKVLDYQGLNAGAVHPLLVYALDHECALADVPGDAIREALITSQVIMTTVTSESLTPDEKVIRVGALISISDADRLIQELEKHPIGLLAASSDDEAEEAIQTAGALAPVEMMSIVGSKGLSSQHVIIIGCDDVNLSKTSRLAFFVGLTRARRSLHLVASMKAGGSTTVHPFLVGLPEETCDYVIYKKTGREAEASTRQLLLDRIATWTRVRRRSRRP